MPQCFACESFDDGSLLLVADYSLSCETKLYKAMRFYSVLMLLVWPVGVPLVFTCVLIRYRHQINGAFWVSKAGKADEKKIFLSEMQIMCLRDEEQDLDGIRLLFETLVYYRVKRT